MISPNKVAIWSNFNKLCPLWTISVISPNKVAIWSNFNKLCPLWTISDESPNKGQYGVTLINCAPCGQLVMNHLIRGNVE